MLYSAKEGEVIKPGVTKLFVAVVLSSLIGGLLSTMVLTTSGAGASETGSGEEGGVFAVAGQISRETYGVYLVDYKRETICVYQFVQAAGSYILSQPGHTLMIQSWTLTIPTHCRRRSGNWWVSKKDYLK